MNDQVWWLVIGGIMALPGLGALYIGLRRDLEETNVKLQVDNLAAEVRRLQVLVDDQQRELGSTKTELANARSIIRVLWDNLQRVVAQLRRKGEEAAADMEALEAMVKAK